jgi:uncharacterized protein YbjT (DUF2867 family)
MIASDDIGKFAADAFVRADDWEGVELDIAGDAATMPEAAAAVSSALGRPISYQQIPIDAVRQHSDDVAKMLEWFDAVGYSADIPALEPRWGIRPVTLATWLKQKR